MASSASPKIVYDWKHSGVATVILDICRVRPKAPPPPRWSWGSADLTYPSSDSETSTSEGNNDLKGVLVEDQEDSSIRVLEYNHGLPVTQKRNVITDNDNGMHLDQLLRNPLYKFSNEKCKDEKVLSDPLVDTETKFSLTQDPEIRDDNILKRKHLTDNESNEIMIGQKLSKSRVSVSSRMYAKPCKKLKDPSHPIIDNEYSEESYKVKNNPNESEHGKQYEKDNEADNLEGDVEGDKGASGTPEPEPENIIIDVCPFDILEIEEQLRVMENGEEHDEMSLTTLCDNPLADEDNENDSFTGIKFRTDIWELEEVDADL